LARGPKRARASLTFAILSFLFVLWPLVAMAGGLAFNVLVMFAAPLLAWPFIRSIRIRIYMLALLAFFVFAGASTFWSPRPVSLLDVDWAALRFGVPNDVVRVALVFLGGGVLLVAARALDEVGRRRLQGVATVALALQLVIVVLLTIFEREAIAFFYPGQPDHDGVQNISRNCLIMAAAAPFLIMGLARGRRRSMAVAIGATILAVEIAVLIKREVFAGLLALVLSGAALAVVRLLPRQGFRVIGGAIALVLLAAPVWSWAASRGVNAATSSSTIDYRQIIWERTLDVVAEEPIKGGGVGVLRTMRDRIDAGAFTDQYVIPNHPHNMMLQVWAETGAIGALLLAAAVLLAAFRLPHPAAIGAAAPRAATLAGAMTAIGCVSFDLWNGWWWALGALLAVLVATSVPAGAARPPQ
jgi:O-antigen ligase